jgi:hypothetical protein
LELKFRKPNVEEELEEFGKKKENLEKVRKIAKNTKYKRNCNSFGVYLKRFGSTCNYHNFYA